MRILIAGAGFAGLTLAALLRQAGIPPVVIEKAPCYDPVGYVIGLWPLGSRILRDLGLYDRYVEVSVATPRYVMNDWRGNLIREHDIGAFFEQYGSIRCVARQQLLLVLLEGAKTSNVRMGTTLQSLEQDSDQVRVKFSDGSEDVFDFVVGCDGIHSQTRRLLFGDIPLRQTGWAGWAWWMDPSLVPAGTIVEYYAPGRYVGVFPALGKTCCFTGFPLKPGDRDDPESRAQNVRVAFGAFGGCVPKMLETLPPSDQISFTRFADIYLKEWARGRVLLIGDAGAGILPTAGIGASMAMESAAVLAAELRNATALGIPQIIEAFIQQRRARIDQVQEESWKLARLVFSGSALDAFLMRLYMRLCSTRRMFKGFLPMLRDQHSNR